MDSARVMTALRNRRWMILAAVAGWTTAVAVNTSRMKREYQASATLMPQEVALEPLHRMQQSADVRDEGDDPVVSEDRMKTVAAVVTSPTVLGQVITDLRLPTTTTLL